MVITQNTQETVGGSAEVFLDGVTVGHTQGDVNINIEKTTFPINVNKFGSNVPVKEVVIGTTATIEVPFAQYTPEVLATAIPEATLTASGTLEVSNTAGTDLLTIAKQLIVSGTGGQQWTFPAAFVVEGFAIPHLVEGQTTIPVTFRAVPDPNNPDDSASVFKFEKF